MGKAEAVCWGVRDGASDREERAWVRAHAALTRLARERAAADAEEGRCLLVGWRAGVHVFLGYGSFSEYVERLLGYSPRATREKLRVAEALEKLPLSAGALEHGKLTWCAARELTRIVTAETEPAWLELAHGKTTRELEQLVAGRRPGDLPPAAADAQPPRRHVLRFEVAPETFATFRQATLSLRQAADDVLDDDTLLLMMARQVLGTPADVGRSSYRISYELCPACGQGSQVVDGKLIAVGDHVLDMAACDGEHVGLHQPPPANENHSAAQESAAEACEPARAAGHSSRVPHDAVAADVLERRATLGRPTAEATAAEVPRARQRIPPAASRAAGEEPAATAAPLGRVPHDGTSNALTTDMLEGPATLERPTADTIAPEAEPREQLLVRESEDARARQRIPPAASRAAGEEPAATAAHPGRAPYDGTSDAVAADELERPATLGRPTAEATAAEVPRARQRTSAARRTVAEVAEPAPAEAPMSREPHDGSSVPARSLAGAAPFEASFETMATVTFGSEDSRTRQPVSCAGSRAIDGAAKPTPHGDTSDAVVARSVAGAAPLETTATVTIGFRSPHAPQVVPSAVNRAVNEVVESAPPAAHVGHMPTNDISDVVTVRVVESAAPVESPAPVAIAAMVQHARQPVRSGGSRAIGEPGEPARSGAAVGRVLSGDTSDAIPADPIESAATVPRPRAVEPAPKVPRARQAVPPAMRRAVLARDRHRCQVPGCTHSQFVDVHHVRPRSEGGRNTACNLLTLCTAHHRATHRGELVIEGSAARPIFRHADGTPYGQPVAGPTIDAHAKVFAALRHLGFRERDVHAVLAELRVEVDLRDAPANVLLREALCRIRPGR